MTRWKVPAALLLLSALIFFARPAFPSAEEAECGEHDGPTCSITRTCKTFLYFFEYGCSTTGADYWKG